jgi:hypothetical protein
MVFSKSEVFPEPGEETKFIAKIFKASKNPRFLSAPN